MTTQKARSDSSKTQKTNDTRTTDTGSRGSSKINVTTLDDGAIRVEREIGGRMLMLETGRMAKQADGAVVARYGDTMVLATAQSAQARDDIDFFPLTVDYREKYSAGGRFPGGFFKREGRPTTREILTCRIIDRSIRPLFPDGFRCETQVLSQVLSSDLEIESDILAAVGSFAAVAVSSIPHDRTLGCVRIGLVGDKLLVNPTWSVLKSPECTLNLTVAGHKDAVVMVEAGANEISEEVMLEALNLGHQVCQDIAEVVDELVKHAGKKKIEFQPPERNEDLDRAIDKQFGTPLKKSATAPGNKHERGDAKKSVVTQALEAFPPPAGLDEKAAKAHEKYVKKVCRELQDQGERESILNGKRSDGRDSKTIRKITIDVGLLPKVHGSTLFTRGETQALCICTLGTSDDAQMRDGIYPEDPQAFMLHYAFPPFSVGEVRRFLAPGRREVGHGALAERAISTVLPVNTEFPYTIRVTSEILESNGSSSMASICGGTLALMDAGVPIREPVAGIAMGLVMEGSKVAILSDILGSEDHCGDMDFKVAGTGKGLTALQMDIKCEGLTREILEAAMQQAREGRLHILREMLKVLRAPREQLSPNAPRLIMVQVPVEKIGAIIGPGGAHVRKLQTDYQVRVAIVDSGQVTIAGVDAEKAETCADYIRSMTAEVEIGTVYKGRVTSIKEFGAFIEILPGQEGLCHVSELSDTFVRSVTDVARIGDELEVKVIEIDDFGKIRLSRRALLEPAGDGGDEGDRGVFRRGPREEGEGEAREAAEAAEGAEGAGVSREEERRPRERRPDDRGRGGGRGGSRGGGRGGPRGGGRGGGRGGPRGGSRDGGRGGRSGGPGGSSSSGSSGSGGSGSGSSSGPGGGSSSDS